MVAVIDDFIAQATPYLGQTFDFIWMIGQLVGILLLLGYGYILWKYNIKLNVREYSKGGRVINYSTRAVNIKDKKTGAPKLKTFGMMGFKGEIINEPPAECLIANRSRITNKMYDFIKKDGLYYPILNFVLGTKKQFKNEAGEMEEIYSIEGSGLEINRDYDAEQSIQNKLIEEAIQFRNRKSTEIVAVYALMIITVIGSFIMMWYAWNQFGNIAQAITSLNAPLEKGLAGAISGIVGPG
ncbi:hypothetical protein LCGC14_2835980 [marine sediment metagenome]|uniref:Uncharacterized protein n=1 Tax=marine sediment metagenome TaxID=412755 RepID=A0A0F9B3N8_9ZZZZ